VREKKGERGIGMKGRKGLNVEGTEEMIPR
jgi:hypothetical protein